MSDQKYFCFLKDLYLLFKKPLMNAVDGLAVPLTHQFEASPSFSSNFLMLDKFSCLIQGSVGLFILFLSSDFALFGLSTFI